MTKPTGIGRGKAPGSRQTQLGAPGVQPKVGPGKPAGETEMPTERAIWVTGEPEDMLTAMKFVATNPAEKPETHFRGQLRRWMEDDVRGFMNRLADLEKASIGKGGGDAPDPEDDPGTERALLACDEWIRKNGVQPGGKT